MVTSHHQFPAPAASWDDSPAVRTERMTILGDLGAESFLPWIRRHALKLGLEQAVDHADFQRIELRISGPADLIDAMEMGCSLGPIDVWVDEIKRAEAVAQDT